MHGNGNQYFSTDKTCKSWCKLDLGNKANDDINTKAFSLLLTAKTTGKKVRINWPDITDCDVDTNKEWAAPGYVFIE